MTLELARPRESTAAAAPARGASWIDRAARRAVCDRLAGLRGGHLRIREANGETGFGPAGSDLRATVVVRDPAFWTAVALRGSVGAGESYVDGHWTCDDLTALVRILVRDRTTLEHVETGLARLAAPLLRLGHALRRNTREGSRRNIAAHYDVGNDFYALWLDESLMYSCAVFDDPEATLEQAQSAKNERLCRMLRLSRGEHLLEIGTGWGGFAMHAASRFGCRVTTATISRAQRDLAVERIARAGLAGRVEVLLCDYRDLAGRYDKLVSIEMIEAVGHEYLDGYFAACARLLRPGGAMALQSITIRDELYDKARRSVDFIQQHVFPGCSIPSLAALRGSAARGGGLEVAAAHEIGPHYATTLRLWRERFRARHADVEALGHGERFARLWEFYFCFCEGGFAEGQIGDVQLLLRSRPGRTPG